jgi:hypothetical protein
VVWTMENASHPCIFTMHPDLEGARKEIWERPDKDGRIARRPSSVGQLLGKAKWEKPLADWIVATGVGLLGPAKQDSKQNGWRGTMDSDGSHLSRIKSLLVFLCFVLHLVLFRLSFLYQWGLIPQIGKTRH